MRHHLLNKNYRRLVCGAALIVVSGLVAGCSSDTMRFSDNFYASVAPTQPNNDERPYDYNRRQQAQQTYEQAQQQPVYQQGQQVYQQGQQQGQVYQQQAQQTYQQGQQVYQQGQQQVQQTYQQPVQTAQAATQQHVAPAAPKAAAVTGGTYVVQSGDTLYSIARSTGVDVTRIREANGLNNGSIRVGQKLVVPGASSSALAANAKASAKEAVTTKVEAAKSATQNVQEKAKEVKTAAASTAASAAEKAQTKAKETVQQAKEAVVDNKESVSKAAENAAVAPESTGVTQMRWPARGRVLSSFGNKEGSSTNDGIDIMVPEGSPVKASENGVVIYAGSGLKEYGNTVLVKHDNNLVTVYGHNSELLVKKGDKVNRGQEIAKSGMSGNASTPRLHFEVRKNSAPVNPTGYLEK